MQVLEHAAAAVVGLGYEVTAREQGRLRTKHAGRIFTTDPGKLRHFLDVTVEGEELRFHFHTGMLGSAWTQSDREWAEARVDELIRETS